MHLESLNSRHGQDWGLLLEGSSASKNMKNSFNDSLNERNRTTVVQYKTANFFILDQGKLFGDDETSDYLLFSACFFSGCIDRWCIKEAVYKALYPVGKLQWKQVTVGKDNGNVVDKGTVLVAVGLCACKTNTGCFGLIVWIDGYR